MCLHASIETILARTGSACGRRGRCSTSRTRRAGRARCMPSGRPIYRSAGTVILTDSRPLAEISAHVIRVWRRESEEFVRGARAAGPEGHGGPPGGIARAAQGPRVRGGPVRRGSRRLPGGGPEGWLESGYHADMHWMERTEGKRTDPGLVLDGARSAIVLGVNYSGGRPRARRAGAGRAPAWARYSLYRDYHDSLKPALAGAGRLLEEALGARPLGLPLLRGHGARP